MGHGGKKWSGWFKYSSPSSTKLFLVVIPLVAIAGFISVKGPDASTWVAVIRSQALLNHTVVTNAVKSSTSEVPNGSSRLGQLARSEELFDSRPRATVAADSHELEEVKSDYASLNRSLSPPLPIHAADVATQPAKHPEKTKREPTLLEKTEGGLVKVRAAIREATRANPSPDPDFVPKGSMYWNAKAFHRSYLEMEKQFKVFVYEEGQPPLFHDGPCKSIYSTEGNFIHAIEISKQFRTRDPNKAHVYFLPFSVTMMVEYLFVNDGKYDLSPVKNATIDYLNVIADKHPYWNRSLGADHFMLACHDWGPEASLSDPYLHKNSIRVFCNANTSEGFNPSKDVTLPEINLLSDTIDGFLGGLPPSKRSILAFFAGGLHGTIRPILLEQWENKDEDVRVHRYLPKGVSYYDTLRNTKYCLCPSGWEVASPRLVEAIYTGCVPVLISENYVPPFSDALNWKSFSVEVSVKNIPNLKTILTSIPAKRYLRMQKRVLEVRRHFELHTPPKRYDVFHMTLHSVWLRRLNLRLRDDQ